MPTFFRTTKFIEVITMGTPGISTIWYDLRKKFNEADEITIEDINRETRKYLTLFLEEGYDATMIAQMLDKYDVFRFYPILKEHGAIMIDFMDLFSDAKEFVEKNFDTFASYGVPVDNIIKTILSDGREYINEDVLKSYIEKGATPRFILWLIEDDDNDIFEILEELIKHDCPKSVITSWFMSSEIGRRDDKIEDIVKYNWEEWSKVLYPERFVDRWIEHFGSQFIAGVYSLKDLPMLVNYDEVINYFSMSEIITMTSGRGIYEFITDYQIVGGDPKKLLNRFKKEIGEPKNDLEKEALRTLEDPGLTIIPNNNNS